MELVSRDLKGTYVGHGLGSFWVFAQPLVVVLTFMIIFGGIIGARMAVTDTFPGDYVSYLLAGLVPWLVMQNALSRGPAIFSGSANLVKQVVFPTEVLPIASVVACFTLYIPCFVLLLGYKMLLGGGLTLLAFALPALVAVHALFALGLMMLLSVLTPFVRDIKEFVLIYSTIAMYFTPAIYLPDWVPDALLPILYLNPASYILWVYQDVMFFGRIEHGFAWCVFGGMTVATFIGGLLVFNKVKPFLGNVL